ncbi:P-loop containing nucleoside triphosphate hydrolase protein [Linnemannia elongata]|nr:P-loop containing nucleoside triphosphate hydrolase protein [Linnemannia elongata]
MDMLMMKTGTLLNSAADVFDQVVLAASQFESTLSPAAMSVVKGFMGNDVLSAGFFLMIIGSSYTFFKDLIIGYYREVQSWFYVSIVVQEGDQLYNWLSDWISERPLTNSIRHLAAKTVWPENDKDLDYFDDGEEKRPKLVYAPGSGTHVLYHMGYKVSVSRNTPEQAASSDDGEQNRFLKKQITISTVGWDMRLLKTVVQDAMDKSYKKKAGKTTIYSTQPYDDYWSYSETRAPRAFHSVLLAKGLKEELLTDITMFRKSARWYHDRGIPYRRGYLLHGPPGTGKTSFIVALAGHLRMNVCIVNLGISGFNDKQLNKLLNSAPRNSILLMEDVDAALIKRKAGKDQEGENNVTLSGILNSLDGITAQEGSVVFMTTNHIQKLAPALIRPGRCDRKLLFDYADEHQIRGMCLKFLLSRSATGQLTRDRLPKGETPSDEVDPEEQARMDAYDAHVHEVTEQICQKITKQDAVTTAQLQAFFMLHRESPDTIVDAIPDFLEELAREREALSTKKRLRRQREDKIKAKKEAEKKAEKEAKIAAGETVEISGDEDEEGEEAASECHSDSDYYEKAEGSSPSVYSAREVNGGLGRRRTTRAPRRVAASSWAA